MVAIWLTAFGTGINSFQPAAAGTIIVVADANTTNTANNLPLYGNFLGSATTVVFSRAEEQQDDIRTYYNGLAGVTATESAVTLNATVLSGVELLVVTRHFNNAFDYTASEIAAVNDFLVGGGSVLMIAEANANSAPLNGYNDFLTGIGSTIQYTGDRFGVDETISPVEATSLTTGITEFSVFHYNTLSGGAAAAIAENGTVVAFETMNAMDVVEPGSLAIVGAGLVGLGFFRRKRPT